ncbi:MAG TPA: hypothetical protein VM452_00750 [Caulifigura sp.]|nr:hypothetical protein [Caulifigura sp.]
MNLRNPKLIRLCGWGTLAITLLVIGAGAFLATTFFQAGETLNGGIGAGITVASALFGCLLSYGCFAFAGLGAAPSAPAAAEAPAKANETASEVAVIAEPESSDDAEIAAVSSARLAAAAALPPELSDEAIPVFVQPPGDSSDPGAFDFEDDLLVVPPPVQALEDSDSLAAPPLDSTAEFDSRMDLPVTIDPLESDEIESSQVSDDVGPPPIPNTQTVAVASALTQTSEVDAIKTPPASTVAPPSPTVAFPDIFKSAPSSAVPSPPAPVVAPAPKAPQPASPAKRAPARKRAAKARPADVHPATFAPHLEDTDQEADDSLPTAAELPDMATTLTPTAPVGGALPTEIPDFFLRMPTGRPMPSMMAAAPMAPIVPRQVAAPKPAAHPPAAVRIVDSTTINSAEDDLVTMTAIPDDWPS